MEIVSRVSQHSYPVVTQWLQTLIHSSFCMVVSSDEPHEDDEDYRRDDGPLDYLCFLFS